MRDLNVKIQNKQVIQVLKENMDECFCNFSVGKCLLNVTQNAYEQQQKTDKFCCIKLRKNCMAKKEAKPKEKWLTRGKYLQQDVSEINGYLLNI